MSTPSLHESLDSAAVARWPVRAGAHLLGIGLTLAVLAALPIALTDLDRHQLPKETLVHLTTWLAVLLVRPARPRLASRALRWSLAGLVMLSVASALFATNPWLGFRAASLTITGAIAFLTARHLASVGAGDILTRWCLVAAATGCASGLAQAYGFTSPLFATTRVPGGTFGNRNFLAHFCALAFPILVVTTLTARRRWMAVCGCVLAAALLGTIVLTRSRAAWLGTLSGEAALVTGLLLAARRGIPVVRQRAQLLIVALVLGAAGAMTLPNALDWKSDSPYSDTLAGLANHQEGSGHGRMLQYRHSLNLALRNPLLGVGPGNWPIRYGEVAPPGDPSWIPTDVIPLNPWPSSDWVALLSERGMVAFLSVILLGLGLFWQAYRGVASGGDRGVAGAALAALLVTATVEGTFDAVLLLAVPGFFVALTSGVLLARAEGEAAVEPVARPGSAAWTLMLAAVLALMTARSAMQTAAYVVAGAGRDRAHLALAATIDPGSYPLRMALAQKGSCRDARAALRLAPLWPAPKAAARRCGPS